MALWTVAFLVAIIAGAAVSAESVTYPEQASSRSVSRIVSGWDATEGQFPYQLSLRLVSTAGFIAGCGGSVIHPEWGMTAAHCTAQQSTVIVLAGAVSMSRPELFFETREWYNHPLYIDVFAPAVQPHDISLLKFGRILTFSERIQPVRLQRAVDMNLDYHDVRMVASGWGRTWTNGATPENLQWVYLRGDSNFYCELMYGNTIVQPSTICASAYNVSSQSTCHGDSGGPLTVLEKDGKVTMIGVTSFVSGRGCHAPRPAGFIRPGHYHEWYTQVTGINFDWEFAPEVEEPGSNEAGGEDNGHSGEDNGHSGEDNGHSGEDNGHSGESNEQSGEDNGHSGESNGHSGESSEDKSGSSSSSSSESNESDEKREADAEEKVFVVNAGIKM